MPEKKRRRWLPGKADDPFDTWVELWLAWIGLMLTLLVIAAVLGTFK